MQFKITLFALRMPFGFQIFLFESKIISRYMLGPLLRGQINFYTLQFCKTSHSCDAPRESSHVTRKRLKQQQEAHQVDLRTLN